MGSSPTTGTAGAPRASAASLASSDGRFLRGLAALLPRAAHAAPRAAPGPADADLPALAAAAVAGIHEPGRSPFPAAWAEAPAEQLPADLARYQWSLRAATRPDSWRVAFAIVEDGAVIGCQDLLADEFAARRTVSSGSWLTRAAQGRGLGREMRAAALLLAFDHLGAEVAESSALAWNTASIRVSTGLGYEPNGTQRTVGADGVAVEEIRFRVTPDTFRRPEWALEVSGLEAARALLITEPSADS